MALAETAREVGLERSVVTMCGIAVSSNHSWEDISLVSEDRRAIESGAAYHIVVYFDVDGIRSRHLLLPYICVIVICNI